MFQGIEKHPCVFSEDCQEEQGDSAGGDDGAQAKAEEAFSRQVVGHCPGERTKDACQHGEWMPWLKEIGLSASTAANYMRIAKEVSADSKMATLPYTKILALMAAPKEEREALAEAAEDMSAAEIRRLTEERNRAAEAANVESARADQAEKDAKMFNQENANLRNKVSVLQNELNGKVQYAEELSREIRKLSDEIDELANNPLSDQLLKADMEISELKAKLLKAENNRVEVEKRVEVAPADYHRLKMEQQELLDAAAAAEERANEAESELERLRMEAAGGKQMDKPIGIVLGQAVNAFLRECDMMTFSPAELQRDSYAVRHCVEQLRDWCRRMDEAMDSPVILEANVV